MTYSKFSHLSIIFLNSLERKLEMLTFYGIILLLSCSSQECSAEFLVVLLSPEAFTPFAVVLSGGLYLQNQKKKKSCRMYCASSL